MSEWCSELLAEAHEVDGFRCGNDTLDEWLRNQAMRAQRSNSARTYVWTPRNDRRVVAYYSIAPTQVLREEISGGLAGGHSVVPAYLLARLALDQTLHGRGLGSELLVDALDTIVRASCTGGGRLIVVDAIDDRAAAFYERYDFRPVRGNGRRLVMKVSTAQQALSMATVRVTGDRVTRLVSIVFDLPDGTVMPVVLSVGEADALTKRMADLLDQAEGQPDIQLNFNKMLTDVLGRDPWRT